MKNLFANQLGNVSVLDGKRGLKTGAFLLAKLAISQATSLLSVIRLLKEKCNLLLRRGTSVIEKRSLCEPPLKLDRVSFPLLGLLSSMNVHKSEVLPLQVWMDGQNSLIVTWF